MTLNSSLDLSCIVLEITNLRKNCTTVPESVFWSNSSSTGTFSSWRELCVKILQSLKTHHTVFCTLIWSLKSWKTTQFSMQPLEQILSSPVAGRYATMRLEVTASRSYLNITAPPKRRYRWRRKRFPKNGIASSSLFCFWRFRAHRLFLFCISHLNSTTRSLAAYHDRGCCCWGSTSSREKESNTVVSFSVTFLLVFSGRESKM